MPSNVKEGATFTKHPTQEGVFLKHLFTGSDTGGCLNNLEVNIVPGFQIAPHAHDDSSEFFYVVGGHGEFLDGTEWKAIKEGDAFMAPMKMNHSIKNTGNKTLVLFSTFCPANR